ncbi:MAG: hypothetical protein AVDCRST_MAG19-2422 [uncultured Thermomicrobiales bacterium]|uniref:DUF488 domain-containing protein n=1 Tax=uncultured Thermomicrobiales bacterium TaxID=1645740 RepID=A0A6J4V5N8_9BACT|nr:MAG: hypothetical protein AVDCRST_MAG19-2422 [uncultured Thermomicrobiales bacterium]
MARTTTTIDTIYTIGFTKKPAARFFGLLREHDVRCLVDVRLNPGGQLSGFAKRDDLRWFLAELAGCDYRHLPALAPTDAILGDYRADGDWARYVRRFEALMDEREVPAALDRALFAERACCLLCSEATPERCHRRLVGERLARSWAGTEVVHLV